MDSLDAEACYRAVQTRDARFDGRLFTGVISTQIYCRPVCPARTPRFENCRFFDSAAAAQEAGFRPCLRCRPETAPELLSRRGTASTVSRALSLIADGALDGNDASVEALAERLGLCGRQLRRLFEKHLGASPLSVAQTRRVLFAKQLIQETGMPMAEVALAAGFGSLRRFNETFQALYQRPPSALRRCPFSAPAQGQSAGVTLDLRYRPPYDWDAMLAYLEARAVPGLEQVCRGAYARTVGDAGCAGTVEVRHTPGRNSLTVTIRLPSVRVLPSVVGRVRRLFDLGADIETIGAHLARDPLLAPMVAQRPGLRAPGSWDGFELGVRAILGQQVTIKSARRLAGELVALCGEPLPMPSDSALRQLFPTPERIVGADLEALPMPRARKQALRMLAEAALADPGLFRCHATLEHAVDKLRAISGIGEWTAQYIALRALREPDAFPATDVGLLRSASLRAVVFSSGTRQQSAELLHRAEAWRPWRAYAAQHLWAADAAATSKEGTHG